MSYEINYNDERFQDVEADKKQAINEVENTYGEMIGQSDSFYKAQIDAARDWEKKQTNLQNQQTDFAIQEIEQKKAQAKKDYTKEQSGAYVDWQKQSNEYGANAEAEAMQGMQNTGYSESSQVSMYNTYQNRVATARESYNRIVLDFDNDITQARLQNNSALAEIAYQSLQTRLELNLQGFQYKNQLLLEKANQKREVNNEYYNRYQNVLAQINTENALAEQIRQYNESMAEEKRQYNEQMALQREQFEWQKEQASSKSSGGSSGGGGGGGSSRSSKSSTSSNNKGSSTGGGSDVSKNKEVSGSDYLNELIASGATKDKVSNEISIALREGAISKEEAADLRKTFTPRGYTY